MPYPMKSKEKLVFPWVFLGFGAQNGETYKNFVGHKNGAEIDLGAKLRMNALPHAEMTKVNIARLR